MDNLIKPYGGKLVDLVVDSDKAELLKKESQHFPSHTLTQRQLCDLELLMNGGFSPLTGFMTQDYYSSVVGNMRLPDGKLWPIPIILDIPDNVASKLELNSSKLALLDEEGFMLAVLNIESKWQPDKKKEAKQVYGTDNDSHPGVKYLYENTHGTYVGGAIEGVQLPFHNDFEILRDTPSELRQLFNKKGWGKVVAFHTSKPMHRIHREITLKAAKDVGANILLHPAVGQTKPGDLHYYARVHCYQAIRKHYSHDMALLSLLPVSVRMAGPREAIMNAIIRQNYGCSHIIIGPEHAAPPGIREYETRFYPSYAAQEMLKKYQNELDILIVPVNEMRYLEEQDQFIEINKLKKLGKEGVLFTDKEIKEYLAHNLIIPDWVTYPDVVEALKKVYLPRNQQGLTLFFTGLSGSGKSTLAKIIYAKFIEDGSRPVTLLDGDIVRQNLSSELGFSKEHRNINVRRIGYVASEITKNGGIAICAPIAPYTEMRRAVREMVEQYGAFIEIHVSTPIEVCESRDRKGLYEKARKGIIPEFTGISDPYEEPKNPDICINTADLAPPEAAQGLFLFLLKAGYIG
ncbi:MAG: bifunctional sulfate adenylyltransferase/adenylylsulfate kinase [Candidatus Heimdallarchaeota archaeon]|nr:bifunctional sulfate adenylyltransferase/adenylylsulfate kinase [Candidatus Heimdallarchaeota archaeon]